MAVLLVLPEPSGLALPGTLPFWKCAPLQNGDVAEELDKMYALVEYTGSQASVP